MKKVIVLLFFIFLTNFAQARDCTKYCSTSTPKKTFGGNLASLSGINLLSRNIIENAISGAIKKETGAKFKIKIDNFYGVNVLSGAFKSISATSKKYAHDGFYLTDIQVKSACSYNRVYFEENKLYFLENMVLTYSVFLTEEDIKNTLASKKIDSRIASLLSNTSNYSGIFSVLNKFKPISIPIKIDEITKAKLKISKIEAIDKNVKLSGYILIPKNK